MENQQPQTPTQEVPLKTSKLPLIFMAIFVILSLSAVAFLWYQNQQLKKIVLSYQTQTQLSPTPVATIDFPPKIFNDCGQINQKTSFTINYPTNWQYSITNREEKTSYLFENPQEKTTEFLEISCGTGYGGACDQKSQVKLSVGEFEVLGCYSNNEWNQIYLNSPNTNSTVSIRSNISNKKYFNQILSTFKFLDATPTPISKACTMEAKICPDGSSVGRTGPNCEFSPCPIP